MFFIFKKRKSRKQLLQEIEELKEEVIKQQSYKEETTLKLDAITKQITTINAVCISLHEDQDDNYVKKCLCNELAKMIMPYVSFEKYKMAGEHWDDEIKHFATIKIVEE